MRAHARARSWTVVYGDMVRAFEKAGYESNVDLFGAPFDFRLHLQGAVLDSMFGQGLFRLVERAVAQTGQRVHLVAHSYGCLAIAYWFEHYRPAGFDEQSWAAWRDAHIASFIPVAGPFAGVPKAMRGIVSGDTFGAPSFLIDINSVVRGTRGLGGLVQLVPDPDLWPANATMVRDEANHRVFGVGDMQQLFEAVGADESLAIWHNTKRLIDTIKKPPVPTFCLYGFGTRTEMEYSYSSLSTKTVQQPHTIHYGEGDGVVPLISLIQCAEWAVEPTPPTNTSTPVRCAEFNLLGHQDLTDSTLIKVMLNLTTGRSALSDCRTEQLDKTLLAMGERMPKRAKALFARRKELGGARRVW